MRKVEVRNKRLAIGLLVTVVLSGYARAIPPASGTDEITVPSTLSRDHVRQLKLGKHVAQFEKSTLNDIRTWAGVGNLEQDGDAGTARSWLCYSLPGQIVWFLSSEMGGLTQLLEVYGEAIAKADPRTGQCPTLPESLRPIALEFGWVGDSEASFRKVLGPPSGVHGEWSQYFYAGKESGPYRAFGETEAKNVEFDVTAFIEVKFRNGKAVAVRASHVTSN